MRYIFCGIMYPNVETNIKEVKKPLAVSSHKFQANMLKGLLDNGQETEVINVPLCRYYPHYKKIFIRSAPCVFEGKTLGRYVEFVNLPGLNYVTQFFALLHGIRRLLKGAGQSPVTLITFNSYLPLVGAMYAAAKWRKNVYLCSVIGDLHGKRGFCMPDSKRYHGLKGKLHILIENCQDALTARFDAFGLLTNDMAEGFGVEHKPHVVVEGIYSEEHPIPALEEADTNTVFYAGSLHAQYGIRHLLNAFSQIHGENYRLIIAGGGDDEASVKECAMRDDRITYLGYITPSEVERQQQMATVLVNPRTSDHEFVKYSFPSKSMECLASGKPYIAHQLTCYPPEYAPYIQQPADESDKALADKIVEVCGLPEEERRALGLRAREFILNQKNPRKQMEKIVQMLQSIAKAAPSGSQR